MKKYTYASLLLQVSRRACTECPLRLQVGETESPRPAHKFVYALTLFLFFIRDEEAKEDHCLCSRGQLF